jgi:hypothetical protein
MPASRPPPREEKTYGEFRTKRLVLEWFGKV